MGDRYYQQMLKQIGKAPGYRGKRKKRMAWTDESRQQAVEMYEDAKPTPENSMEIVKEIAEELGESPNGVRMVLTRAGVYVKKTAAAAAKNSGSGNRVSKAGAQDALTAAIKDAGQEPDDEIISKLTGKACVYLTEVINAINT